MDLSKDMHRLTRPVHIMPEDIAAALDARGLRARYHARPAFQQNDYLGWIGRARRAETRRRRLDQMLEELERGGLYMRMRWTG